MVALVDYYRYYVPAAQRLNVVVMNSAAIAAQSSNVYQEAYSGESSITLPFTPYGTDSVDVFVNGVNIVNKLIDPIVGGYTYTRFSVNGPTLTWIDGPGQGDQLLIVSYLGVSESAFYRIDLSNQLIQGIVDTGNNNAFIGAVECYPVIVHQPVNGFVRIGADRISFEYSMNSTKPGADSFGYKLVSRYGQESDPQCVYINNGVTTQGS